MEWGIKDRRDFLFGAVVIFRHCFLALPPPEFQDSSGHDVKLRRCGIGGTRGRRLGVDQMPPRPDVEHDEECSIERMACRSWPAP